MSRAISLLLAGLLLLSPVGCDRKEEAKPQQDGGKLPGTPVKRDAGGSGGRTPPPPPPPAVKYAPPGQQRMRRTGHPLLVLAATESGSVLPSSACSHRGCSRGAYATPLAVRWKWTCRQRPSWRCHTRVSVVACVMAV